MVRPKASEHNLSVAVSFASMLISSDEDHVRMESRIPFIGPRSIYSLFSEALPALSRDVRHKYPMNRKGVTEVELNKALLRSGLSADRRFEFFDAVPRSSSNRSTLVIGA